jgi:hypothetical protein
MAETIRPSLFSQITVQHGPAGLLGRVFLLCEAQLRERGVSLAFASMSDLVAVNKANSDSWAPLWSGFDPAFSNLTPDNSFCILGYNRHGDVVTTQAARFLDWPETTYQREAEALRLAYADPDASKLPGEPGESPDAWSTPGPPGTGRTTEARDSYRYCRAWHARSPIRAGPRTARSP